MLWHKNCFVLMKGETKKMRVVTAKGSYEKMGFELGYKLTDEIHQNLALLEIQAMNKGMEKKEVDIYCQLYADIVSISSKKMMDGMSKGSGISYDSILRYNALMEVLHMEECTTFAAVGSASIGGKAYLMKNRDTQGRYEFKGEGYYKNRWVNIIQCLESEDGNVMIGVTNAGSTGLMAGMNKHGVAVASNAGDTIESDSMLTKKIGISGRPQMLREALECSTAYEAVNLTLRKLTKSPMKVPGILWFVDAGNIYVVEGSLNQYAVQHITDGTTSRSNHFLLLDHQNNEKSVSPICRKIRADELMTKNFGRISREKLIEFSMDHKNGPSENSICRHSENIQESVTVSSTVMEIDRENPQKSTISIALGSPCWAWSKKDGNITFRLDQDIKMIPKRFLDGSVYKEHIRYDARYSK
jgi:hypothetical protein